MIHETDDFELSLIDTCFYSSEEEKSFVQEAQVADLSHGYDETTAADRLKLSMHALSSFYNKTLVNQNKNVNDFLKEIEQNLDEIDDHGEVKIKTEADCSAENSDLNPLEALHNLNNAEELNKTAEEESKTQEGFLSKESIDMIVGNYKTIKQDQLNRSVYFYKQFKLNLNELIEKKTRVFEINEFLGLDELDLFLEKIFQVSHKIKKSTRSSKRDDTTRGDESSAQNAFIYGPAGCGKMSLLINKLFNKGLVCKASLNLTDLTEYSLDPRLEIIYLDFKRPEIAVNTTVIDSLISSIDLLLCGQKVTVLIVIKNLELLENEPGTAAARSQIIGDLIYHLSNNQTSDWDFELAERYSGKLFYLLLSEKPWCLPRTLVYQFEKRIYCPSLSRLASFGAFFNTKLDNLLDRLEQEYTFSHKLKEFFDSFNLCKTISAKLCESCVKLGVLDQILDRIESVLRIKLDKYFKKKLSDLNLTRDDLARLVNNSLNKTSKASSNWNTVRNRILSVQKTSVSSKKSVCVTAAGLKSQIWEDKSLELSTALLDELNACIVENAVSCDEWRKYEEFNKEL